MDLGIWMMLLMISFLLALCFEELKAIRKALTQGAQPHKGNAE